ncbi:MAG: hypothetical protein ACLRWP_05320 [Bilophila wadsworthia]
MKRISPRQPHGGGLRSRQQRGEPAQPDQAVHDRGPQPHPQEAQGDHAPASLNESVAQLAGRLRDNLKGKLENTIGGSGNSGDEVTNLA